MWSAPYKHSQSRNVYFLILVEKVTNVSFLPPPPDSKIVSHAPDKLVYRQISTWTNWLMDKLWHLGQIATLRTNCHPNFGHKLWQLGRIATLLLIGVGFLPPPLSQSKIISHPFNFFPGCIIWIVSRDWISNSCHVRFTRIRCYQRCYADKLSLFNSRNFM